jgi:hypothetical protein
MDDIFIFRTCSKMLFLSINIISHLQYLCVESREEAYDFYDVLGQTSYDFILLYDFKKRGYITHVYK